MKARTILLGLWAAKEKKWDDIFTALKNKEMPENLGELGEKYENDENLITILDEEYPKILKEQCYKPPFVATRDLITRVCNSPLLDECDITTIRNLYENGKLNQAEQEYRDYKKAEEKFEKTLFA